MKERQSPLKIKIGFKKLFESYRNRLNSNIPAVAERAKAVLAIEQEYPELSKGVEKKTDLDRLSEPIHFVLQDLFPDVLTDNEIKIATAPFQEKVLRASRRYQNIRQTAGNDFKMELTDFNDSEYYIMACNIILSQYYGYHADFKRPFYYQIPMNNSLIKSYRVLYNGDFVDIEKGPGAKEITRDDLAELLDNFSNIELWKEKFPPGSWIFNGFVIANMYDATTELAVSEFKEDLLGLEAGNENIINRFRSTMQSVYGLSDISVGFSMYEKEEKTLVNPGKAAKFKSFLLENEECADCHAALCEHSYSVLFEEQNVLALSNIERSLRQNPENTLIKQLHAKGVGSIILAPLVSNGEMLGILEIASPNVEDLNSINAQKLSDFLPFLVETVQREVVKKQNQIDLLIQNECTSVHNSVYWRFRQEAKRVLNLQREGLPASFREVVFEGVYPLFGQMDIKGSSEARNHATQRDLELQLRLVKRILKSIHQEEPLPIYEQLIFTTDTFLNEIEEVLEVDSERKVLNFLQNDILPLYEHLVKGGERMKALIDSYYEKIDASKGFVYKHRKDYDESVYQVNKTLAGLLDKKQQEAQAMYPHYYERFKTDGVEHNMYIGEAITREESFNKIYLYNLRLWQLQVMCEMENAFYRMKKELPVAMEIASMILVFNNALSLRFRMDEKRFDVDGTYNARYEVVKKRVDKAFIKGTEERLTQPGKLVIVYSQDEDEIEYLNYIKFLQSKQYLGEEVEVLELEDLQGVTGLKALRVEVLYHDKNLGKASYTYDELMDELLN